MYTCLVFLTAILLGDDSTDEERDWLCDVAFGATGTYNQRQRQELGYFPWKATE